MAELSRLEVEEVLKKIVDPYVDWDLIRAKSIQDIAIQGNEVTIKVVLGYPAKGYQAKLAEIIQERVQALSGVGKVAVTVESKIVTHAVQKGLKPLPHIKNIIAVASGKGGVGKSTLSVNLALALSAEGASVGILDADIYGPSQPKMLGITDRPESPDGKTIYPLKNHGLQAMSIGFLIDEETPMIWRGPMVTQALEQLLHDTQWEDLDFLIIDLPPGTGDTQLTLAQKVPVSGAVIVTTPQDIALLDARKAYKMFQKVEVPVLGVVENMSLHICSHCGHHEPIFGEGGGKQMAQEYEVPFLGSLPLDRSIREATDQGNPTVASSPDSPISLMYREIARRTAGVLARQSKDYSARFPSIVVEN